MEFRVLGPLDVVEAGRVLELPRGKPRALLALLLLDAGRVVPVDRLVDGLWADRPPSSAAKLVQGYVSQLRKLLPPGVLETRAPGYVVRVPDDDLDLLRFERLRREAQASAAAGRLEEAAACLREALALWQGSPLAELAETPTGRAETARLESLRLRAVEERLDIELALGRGRELVGELEALVREQPLHERFRAQLMLALYRAGRQADALEAYRRGRSLLVEELGLEPSRELQELERRILAHDRALDGAAPPRGGDRDESLRGTVTVVCTDATGMRALVRELGPDRFGDVLNRYTRVVRDALAELGGRNFEVAFDSVVAAFPTARQAARAAAAAQRAVAAEEWPYGTRVALKVALHSGEAGAGWIGPAVFRCVELCGTARPGQIVVSQATAALLAEEDLGELALRPRGEGGFELVVADVAVVR